MSQGVDLLEEAIARALAEKDAALAESRINATEMVVRCAERQHRGTEPVIDKVGEHLISLERTPRPTKTIEPESDSGIRDAYPLPPEESC